VKIRRLGRGDALDGAIHLLQRFFHEEGFDTPDEVIARNTRRMGFAHSTGHWGSKTKAG
jgi:hypothetical protein